MACPKAAPPGFLGLEPDPQKANAMAHATKASRRSTPAEGQHIRTAGASRAEREIPQEILQEIRKIEEKWSDGFPASGDA